MKIKKSLIAFAATAILVWLAAIGICVTLLVQIIKALMKYVGS